MNATMYNVVFPLAKKNEYLANDTVDFVLSLENKKLVPGSLAITGECQILKDVNAGTPIGADDEVLIALMLGTMPVSEILLVSSVRSVSPNHLVTTLAISR